MPFKNPLAVAAANIPALAALPRVGLGLLVDGGMPDQMKMYIGAFLLAAASVVVLASSLRRAGSSSATR